MEEGLVRLPLATEGLKMAREVVLAERDDRPQHYRIRSIPAFIYGVAAGDVVAILDAESGRFQLVDRGGQISVRAFVDGSLDREDIRSFVETLVSAGGTYEVGKNDQARDGTSLLLMSFQATLGFGRIEKLLKMIEGPGVQWEYGNVYDKDGKPLNWWKA